MHKKGSTFYPAAKAKALELFDKGLNCPAVYHELQKEFAEDKRPPDVRYVYRWRKEWEMTRKHDHIAAIMASENLVVAEQSALLAQDRGRMGKAGLDLVEAPTLDELMEGGVPKEVAPGLLQQWDLAYENRSEDITNICQRVVSIYRDFPDIPLLNAWTLALMEATVQTSNNDFAKKIAHLLRRYRPWQGKENREAFNNMAEHWNLFGPLWNPKAEAQKAQQPPMDIRP
jgi:hypothetical protein